MKSDFSPYYTVIVTGSGKYLYQGDNLFKAHKVFSEKENSCLQVYRYDPRNNGWDEPILLKEYHHQKNKN